MRVLMVFFLRRMHFVFPALKKKKKKEKTYQKRRESTLLTLNNNYEKRYWKPHIRGGPTRILGIQ